LCFMLPIGIIKFFRVVFRLSLFSSVYETMRVSNGSFHSHTLFLPTFYSLANY